MFHHQLDLIVRWCHLHQRNLFFELLFISFRAPSKVLCWCLANQRVSRAVTACMHACMLMDVPVGHRVRLQFVCTAHTCTYMHTAQQQQHANNKNSNERCPGTRVDVHVYLMYTRNCVQMMQYWQLFRLPT